MTVRYVLDPETELDNDRLIARRQPDLAYVVGRPMLHSADGREAIGLPAHAVGFACANPMEGRSPRARPGELCPEWLWPLTDPGLIIPVEILRQ